VGVVAGSLIGKLPQVHTIWAAGSAEGVSVISIWVEMVSMGIQFAYNVIRGTPLSTYAEVPILFVQLLLLALVAAWADGYLGGHVWLGCFVVAGCTSAMAASVLPHSVTLALYAANATFAFFIIGPQVIMNRRKRSTGRLSLAVTGMAFSGLTSRLFTTLVEVEDNMLRLTIGLNWLLTGVLMLQFWIYAPSKSEATQVASKSTMVVQVIMPMPWDVSVHSSPEAAPARSFESLRNRSGTFVQVLSKIGSHACLSEFVGDDGFEEPLAKVKSFSNFPMVRSMTSFPSFSDISRQQTW